MEGKLAERAGEGKVAHRPTAQAVLRAILELQLAQGLVKGDDDIGHIRVSRPAGASRDFPHGGRGILGFPRAGILRKVQH